MTEYTLYYSPDSANLVVRMALEEANASYMTTLVDRSRGGQRSAEFLSLNPQGLLPVLTDGDTVLFETAAILLYLVDRHSGLGPSPGNGARADLYRWLFYISNTVHAELRMRFYATRFVVDANHAGSLRSAVGSRLRTHLELLDGVIRRHGNGWLLDTGFSVCDLYLAVCCRWMVLYPMGDAVSSEEIEALPSLRSMLECLESRESVRVACEAEWIEPPYLLRPRIPVPPVGSVLG
jgi:glutathione S-transferase